jgi:hypothetical protein
MRRRHIRFCVGIIAGLTMSGGAWAAPGPAEHLALRSTPISALLGLSPNEVRERLGLNAVDAHFVSEVKLSDGITTAILTTSDLAARGSRCPRKMNVRLLVPALPSPFGAPLFVFEEDRLIAVRHASLPLDAAGTANIETDCFDLHQQPTGQGFIGWAMRPFYPLAAPEVARERRAGDDLARLRLGEEPPGGAAAYLDAPPASIQIRRREGNTASLVLRHGEAVQIEIRNGRVAEIIRGKFESTGSGARCALSEDGGLRCPAGPADSR